LARVILNGNLDAILDETISGVVDMYVATGDTMIRNAQRDIQHNFFMLFDIMDTLEASSAAFNKCLQVGILYNNTSTYSNTWCRALAKEPKLLNYKKPHVLVSLPFSQSFWKVFG
jgi:hypothetical protein